MWLWERSQHNIASLVGKTFLLSHMLTAILLLTLVVFMCELRVWHHICYSAHEAQRHLIVLTT